MSAFAIASTFGSSGSSCSSGSSGSSGSNFDSEPVHIFAWPLMEEVVYAIQQQKVGINTAYTINEDKSKDIDLSHVPEATKIIVLVGSHWDILSVKKAKDAGKSVKMVTWTGNGVPDSEMAQYIDEGMVYMDWTDTKSSFNWKQMLANGQPGCPLKYSHEDLESFIQGLLFGSGKNMVKVLEDWINGTEGEPMEDKVNHFISIGETLAKSRHQVAQDTVNVKRFTREISIGGYRGRVVLSGPFNVINLTKEAAKGFDIGVCLRHEFDQRLGETQTRLTFYTETPEKVDLSFLKEYPYKGGSSDGVFYGCSFNQFFTIPEDASSLDNCIPRAVPFKDVVKVGYSVRTAKFHGEDYTLLVSTKEMPLADFCESDNVIHIRYIMGLLDSVAGNADIMTEITFCVKEPTDETVTEPVFTITNVCGATPSDVQVNGYNLYTLTYPFYLRVPVKADDLLSLLVI